MFPNPVDRYAEPFVEVDPTGRYGRYDDLLGAGAGAGAVKRVYRGFDQEEGIEVAWNKVRLRSFSDDQPMLDRLFEEVRLLRTLRHENIIALYHMWVEEGSTLNFITEDYTSGKRHRLVSLKEMVAPDFAGARLTPQPRTLLHSPRSQLLYQWQYRPGKDWGSGASGNRGEEPRSTLHPEFLGTPEFMAPELYEEYTEQVDINSFGMCVLEMVTREIPYSECDSVANICCKVTAGVRPAAMAKIKDPEVRAFIERCLAKPRARPSASEFLMDQFFQGLDEDVSALHQSPNPPSQPPAFVASATAATVDPSYLRLH